MNPDDVISFSHGFSGLTIHYNNNWRAVKHRLLAPTPVVSDSVGLRWVLIICVSSNLR